MSGPTSDADRVTRDEGWVSAEVTLVPSEVAPGGSIRVQITLQPVLAKKAHWNNEAEGLFLSVTPPPGWSIDRQEQRFARPADPVSHEPRKMEFEMAVDADAREQTAITTAYALYYICEDTRGTCLYRRKDMTIPVMVRRAPR